jgi:hypothetical protein
MGPVCCPETSVMNYHYTLRNIPEERSSHLLRGRNLKSRHIWLINIKMALHCTVHTEARVHKNTEISVNILTMAADGHKRSVSRSASFTAHSKPARVDPIVGLAVVTRRFLPLRPTSRRFTTSPVSGYILHTTLESPCICLLPCSSK